MLVTIHQFDAVSTIGFIFSKVDDVNIVYFRYSLLIYHFTFFITNQDIHIINNVRRDDCDNVIVEIYLYTTSGRFMFFSTFLESSYKVIKAAALRSGVSRSVMQACWYAAGEVIFFGDFFNISRNHYMRTSMLGKSQINLAFLSFLRNFAP